MRYFPATQNNDLLDQLGDARYFRVLDLTSGYWQAPMHTDSMEKTAFATPQGLYNIGRCSLASRMHMEYSNETWYRCWLVCILKIDLTGGLYTRYIGVLLYSQRTPGASLSSYPAQPDAGLKLNPSKCYFICEEVEYLGHLITPPGLKDNHRLVSSCCCGLSTAPEPV